MATCDASPAVRRTALSGLARAAGPGGAAEALRRSGRCLDAAPEVRRHLYAVLRASYREASEDGAAGGSAAEPAPPPPPVELLQVGLKDMDTEARFLCEAALGAWFRAAGGGLAELRGLLEAMEAWRSEAAAALAEKAVRAIVLQGDGRRLLEAEACEALVPAEDVAESAPVQAGTVQESLSSRVARALLWRVASTLDSARPLGESQHAAVVCQIGRALDAGRSPELEQLLRLAADSAADSAGPGALLPAAARVLLQLPAHGGEPAGEVACVAAPRAARVAVRLVRQALEGEAAPLARGAAGGEARLLGAVAEALEWLWDPAGGASASHPADPVAAAWRAALREAAPAEGLRAAGERLDAGLQALGAAAECGGAAPAPSLAEDAHAVRSLTARALRLIEEVLCQSSVCREFDAPHALLGDLLVDRWLRPTLVRADAAEPRLGGDHWAALRAQAVKCMALNALTDSETAAAHWPFFQSVLARYNPTVTLYRLGSGAAAYAGQIAETCLLFLSDALLLYGARSPEFADGEAAKELFRAAAPLLGPPVSGMHTLPTLGAGQGVGPLVAEWPRQAGGVGVPSGLRRRLAERLCTLLLVGGGWCPGHGAGGSDEPDEEEPLLPRPPPAVAWAVAWLLLEAFYQPFPMSAAGTAARRMEEAEEAAHRSRLLCFFGCLGRASLAHAGLLAAGTEVLLSTGLWRLGARAPFPLGNNRQWRPLQLPRLLRLVGHQLRTCHAAPEGGCGGAGAPAAAARLWLEGIWRPLALICLEQRPGDPDPCLPEALLAALAPAAEGPSPQGGGAPALLGAGRLCPAAVDEVSAAAGRIAERWSGGKAKEQADCSQNGASRRAAQQLRRLCARLRPGGQLEAGGEGAGPEAPGLEELAARRRQRLREGLVDLQVDANGFVAAATDALRQCVKARRSSMCARVRRVVPAAEAVGEKSPARAAAAGPAEAARRPRKAKGIVRMFPDYGSAELPEDPIDCSQDVLSKDKRRAHGAREAPTPVRRRARCKRDRASDDDSEGPPPWQAPRLLLSPGTPR